MGKYKYGVLVPHNVAEALEFDKKNGNNLWQEAIKKEIDAIWTMNTFKRVAKGRELYVRNNYQFAPLCIIFDVKQDLQCKACLVIGGHVIDAAGHDTYASNMQSISARLLMLIAAANKLDVLTGDIATAYLFAKNNLPIYVRLGKEFSVYDSDITAGSIATVEKALYGLPTSANRWHAHLADTLRSMGFQSI